MGRRRGGEPEKPLPNPSREPETAQNASYCVSCGLAKHPGSTCYAASLIAARIRAEQEQPDSALEQPVVDDDTASPNTVMSPNRRSKYRSAHKGEHRDYMRQYMRAYRARGKA